ncbi:hypothetical protein HK105_205440 [Polyrhizophydium stewartii]|uniref:Uncharacterized protein n=1 Tax=Polyrhizophydium stewartii TaxID=2732419 RepID=A0ABR4N6E8_9FUNG
MSSSSSSSRAPSQPPSVAPSQGPTAADPSDPSPSPSQSPPPPPPPPSPSESPSPPRPSSSPSPRPSQSPRPSPSPDPESSSAAASATSSRSPTPSSSPAATTTRSPTAAAPSTGALRPQASDSVVPALPPGRSDPPGLAADDGAGGGGLSPATTGAIAAAALLVVIAAVALFVLRRRSHNRRSALALVDAEMSSSPNASTSRPTFAAMRSHPLASGPILSEPDQTRGSWHAAAAAAVIARGPGAVHSDTPGVAGFSSTKMLVEQDPAHPVYVLTPSVAPLYAQQPLPAQVDPYALPPQQHQNMQLHHSSNMQPPPPLIPYDQSDVEEYSYYTQFIDPAQLDAQRAAFLAETYPPGSPEAIAAQRLAEQQRRLAEQRLAEQRPVSPPAAASPESQVPAASAPAAAPPPATGAYDSLDRYSHIQLSSGPEDPQPPAAQPARPFVAPAPWYNRHQPSTTSPLASSTDDSDARL